MNQTDTLDNVFSALGDATRRDILKRLISEDLSVGVISESYDMSLPAVSKHIAILETAGLVNVTKQGRQKIASISFHRLRSAQIWMESLDDGASIWDKLEEQLKELE